MRLYYSLPFAAGFAIIVFYLTGGNVHSILGKMFLSCFALLGVISAGYVLNDVCDVNIDRINCPNRPLAAGKLWTKTALIWSIVLLAAGVSAGAFCGFSFFISIVAVASLLVFYDVYSKKIGIFKDVLAAVLMTSLYPLAFMLTEPVQTPRLNVFLIHPVWLFLSSMGYEMLKDIRDIKGDMKINGHRSNYGRDKRFLIMPRILILAGSAVIPLPFILGYCGQIYLIASIGAVILAVCAAFNKPAFAIRYVYAEVFLVTAGSLADLLVFGP